MSDPYNTPQGNLETNLVYCRDCGAKISKNAASCPACGAPQSINGRNKVVAALLALFLGGFGLHRFYLGQWWGILYLLFIWTSIPSIISFIEAIVFLFTSEQSWNEKYGNKKGSSALVLILVSFLLIIPLMGILAAIAIPSYQDYVDKAKQVQIQKE